MRVTLVDTSKLPIWPGMLHPVTGEEIRAIGLCANGDPIWPVFGADGDEGGEGEGNADGDDGDAEEDDEGQDGDDGDTNDDDGDEDPKSLKAKAKKLQEDYDRLKKQLSASDKNKSAAEKELEKIRRSKQDELTNAKEDVSKLTKERDSLTETVRKLALGQAFVNASMKLKVSWHDLDVAMNAAGSALKDLEVDENGQVQGDLESLVKKLKKSHSFLVNSGDADEDEEDDDTKKRTGVPVGSGGKRKVKGRKPGELTQEELARRFPVIR